MKRLLLVLGICMLGVLAASQSRPSSPYAYVTWETNPGGPRSEVFEACGFIEENTQDVVTLCLRHKIAPTHACFEDVTIDWGNVTEAFYLETGGPIIRGQ